MNKMAKMKLNTVLMSVTLMLVILVAGVVAYEMIAVPNGAPNIKTGSILGSGTTPTPTPAGGVASGQSEPLQFVLSDNLAGGAISGATIKVYTSTSQLKDSLTTTPSGVANTTTLWQAGQTGYVEVSKTLYVSECIPFTVPATVTNGLYNAPSYYIPLTDCVLGTYSILCHDQYGNVYTTTNTINVTALNGGTVAAPTTSVTLTFTVYDSVSNTGYITTFDSLYNVNQAAAIDMYTTGSSVSLPSGIQGGVTAQVFPRGSNTYWSTTLPDSGLTSQKIGQNQVQAGQTGYSITINLAALAHGSTQVFYTNLVAPFDQTYYQANGVGGPNAVSPLTATTGVFTFTIQA